MSIEDKNFNPIEFNSQFLTKNNSKQYNFNSIMLLLTNLYGPEDNFDKKSSHVIAALIRRFSEAKKNNYKEVIVWGDGKATRDFCYAEDVANGLVLAAEKYNDSSPLNLASGKEISIKDLALIIKKKIGINISFLSFLKIKIDGLVKREIQKTLKL